MSPLARVKLALLLSVLWAWTSAAAHAQPAEKAPQTRRKAPAPGKTRKQKEQVKPAPTTDLAAAAKSLNSPKVDEALNAAVALSAVGNDQAT